MSNLCKLDDKHVPLYRILWISELPHFCGSTECQREGQYEVHLDQGEAIWASKSEKEAALLAWEAWLDGEGRAPGSDG